jgi:hypothetical protein
MKLRAPICTDRFKGMWKPPEVSHIMMKFNCLNDRSKISRLQTTSFTTLNVFVILLWQGNERSAICGFDEWIVWNTTELNKQKE